MNSNLLKGYIVSKGLSVEELVSILKEKGLRMSKVTFYRNLRGEQEFNRLEIIAIAETLEMSDDDLLNIFFNEKVS